VLTREGDFEKLRQEFVEELKRKRYSEGYLHHARERLTLLFQFLREQGIEDVRLVTPSHVVFFMSHLKKRKTRRGTTFAPCTQSSYLTVVRGFFAFLEKRSVLLSNPASGIRFPTPQRLPRVVLSRAQMLRLLEAPSAINAIGLRDRAILETFYGTAVRLEECRRLNVSDVDLQAEELWVRDGKGRKDRVLPIPRQSLESLERYFNEARPYLLHDLQEEAFFITRSGRRLSRSTVRTLLQSYGRMAGIPHSVHPHALRHACATHLLEGGADIRHIQRILGHRDLHTTEIYTKVQTADLRKVLARSHPREKKRKGKTRSLND
jgi:integrase/recombinase XerD